MNNKFLLFCKKHWNRPFTLGMILEYSLKHTNQTTAPPIFSMINWVLLHMGDSTPAEQEVVDHAEYVLLNNLIGNIRFFEDLMDEIQSEGTGDDKCRCFRFASDFIKEMVHRIVRKYYQGSAANLALIEIAFFDHNILKKRNAHTGLINTLIKWGALDKLSDKEIKRLMNGMATKMHSVPSDGYMDWNGSDYVNDKKTCLDIGKELGSTMPYCRKKEV